MELDITEISNFDGKRYCRSYIKRTVLIQYDIWENILSFTRHTRRLSALNNNFPILHCLKYLFVQSTSQVQVSILYH